MRYCLSGTVGPRLMHSVCLVYYQKKASRGVQFEGIIGLLKPALCDEVWSASEQLAHTAVRSVMNVLSPLLGSIRCRRESSATAERLETPERQCGTLPTKPPLCLLLIRPLSSDHNPSSPSLSLSPQTASHSYSHPLDIPCPPKAEFVASSFALPLVKRYETQLDTPQSSTP